MSDCVFSNIDERIFTLNVIELLAAIFRGPDANDWEAIFTIGVPELLANIPEESSDLTPSLRDLQDSRPKKSESSMTILETEYVRLFVAGRGGVVAPLYESCHHGDAPRIMGDSALSMQSRLNAAGLEISLDSNEPPDHLSIELEYLYHQLSTAWTTNTPSLEAKAREFARCDMLPWVRRFNEAIAQGEPHPVFLNAAKLTEAILQQIGE